MTNRDSFIFSFQIYYFFLISFSYFIALAKTFSSMFNEYVDWTFCVFSPNFVGKEFILWDLNAVEDLPALQERQVDPWVGKIPWRKKWQPTLVFLPGEFHGQRSLACSSPGAAKSWTHWVTNTYTLPSILAWEIPWTEEPGGLQSMGLQRIQCDLATKQQQQFSLLLSSVCYL